MRGRAAVRVGGLIGVSEWVGVGGRAGWRSGGWFHQFLAHGKMSIFRKFENPSLKTVRGVDFSNC